MNSAYGLGHNSVYGGYSPQGWFNQPSLGSNLWGNSTSSFGFNNLGNNNLMPVSFTGSAYSNLGNVANNGINFMAGNRALSQANSYGANIPMGDNSSAFGNMNWGGIVSSAVNGIATLADVYSQHRKRREEIKNLKAQRDIMEYNLNKDKAEYQKFKNNRKNVTSAYAM